MIESAFLTFMLAFMLDDVLVLHLPLANHQTNNIA